MSGLDASAAGGAASLVREMGTAIIGWALAGWIVVYNIFRIVTGDEPSSVFWITLPIGAAAGVAAYLLIFRRVRNTLALRRAERLKLEADHGSGTSEAAGEALEEPQEDALRIAVWAFAGFGAVALLMGALLIVDFAAAASGDRPITSLVLGAWNVVAALWAADEIARIRVFELDGLDFSVFMTAFTAVLGALGFARDFFPVGQLVLIVVSALAGALIGLAAWRLLPKRGIPILAPLALIASLAAFLLAVLV